jgi:hypothetical protein
MSAALRGLPASLGLVSATVLAALPFTKVWRRVSPQVPWRYVAE